MSALLKALLLLTLVALPAYCGWILYTEKNEAAASAKHRAPAALSAQALDELRFSPREGTRYEYSFQRKLSFRGMNIPDVEYDGVFVIDVLDTDRRGFSAILSHRLRGHPQETPARFYARIDAKGKRVELRSPALLDDQAKQHANILKDLIALWVFPLEVDTVGRFRASFSALEGGWKKRKLAYEKETSPAIFHSEHWLLWGEGVPREIRGEERTHFAGGALPLTTETVYAMELHGLSMIPAVRENSDWSKPETLALSPVRQEELDPEDLGIRWEKTREELLVILSYIPSERLRIFGDLVRLLKSGKVTARELRAILPRNAVRLGAASPLFQSVVGALASSGGQEALAVLREIYADPECPDSGKGSVLAALTTSEIPVDEPTRDFLAERMKAEENRDLANGAAFALGASLQAAGDSASATAALQDIHQAWNAASGDLATQLALLDVMGNSGRAEFLPELRAAMASENEEAVQAKAIFSLRFLKGEEATALLATQLENPLPVLRDAAIEAARIGPWREALRGPLLHCSARDPVAQLRKSCQAAILGADGRLAQNP